MNEREELYEQFCNIVNMDVKELKEYAKHDYLIDYIHLKIINRVIHLLNTPKFEWREQELKMARNTINTVNNIKNELPKRIRLGEKNTQLIMLKCNGYDPKKKGAA